MQRSAQLLFAIATLALAQSSLLACSKKAPEPSPSAEVAKVSPQIALAAPTAALTQRPSVPLEGLQTACDQHLAKYAAANKNAGTACSATERVLFQKDTTGRCLNCLFQGGCLDDTQGDSNKECEDVGPAGITTGTEVQCLDTLRCLVGASSADGTAGPSPAHGLAINAYCGKEPISPNCTGTPGPAGLCAAVEKAGYPPTFSPASVVPNFGKRSYASGMANAILVCAYANACKSCME